jgi:hypothetical protein
MKKTFTIFFLSICILQVKAQSYSGPESVEYDASHNRYLVSCNGTVKSIQQVVPPNAPTLFTSTTGSPYGLEILGGKVWSCEGGRIKSYDLNTAALVDNFNLGATFLNGITSDGVQYLFTSDYTTKKIYRVNTLTGAFNVMVANTVTAPNGMWYDGANNRLLFVNWNSSAPVKAISLADSTVTTVVTTTQANCDGIARDGAGRYYISSWTPQAVYRYSSSFASPTAVVTTGLSNPADIYYNALNDTLAVPNAGNNTVTFYYMGSPASVSENASASFVNVFPNPSKGDATIEYTLPASALVRISIFSEGGKLVSVLLNEFQQAGMHSIPFKREGLSAGQYFYVLEAGNQSFKGLITLVKED